MDGSLAVRVDDGMDLVDEAAADKDRALVAYRQRTGVRHAGGVNLDIEAGRHLKLCQGQFVHRGWNRRRRDRRKLRRGLIVGGTPDQGRTRRKRRRRDWRIGRLLRGSAEHKYADKSAGEQQAARRGRADHHEVLPCMEALILTRGTTMPAPVAFLGGTLQYFPVAT